MNKLFSVAFMDAETIKQYQDDPEAFKQAVEFVKESAIDDLKHQAKKHGLKNYQIKEVDGETAIRCADTDCLEFRFVLTTEEEIKPLQYTVKLNGGTKEALTLQVGMQLAVMRVDYEKAEVVLVEVL